MSQTILITGGTGKFGRKFVEHFLEKNWQILFTTTSKERGENLIKDFSEPDNLHPIVSDLTSPAAVSELLEHLRMHGFCVNHLVNNARSLDLLRTNALGQTSREDFMAEYLLDVVVPYELSMALFNTQPEALKTITNIGSQYGVVAANPHLYDDYPKQSPIQYGVAKAALSHLTKELAVRMASSEIRVNCIAYGGVEGRADDAFKARYAKLTPSARMLKEEEVVGPLDFLLGASSSAVSGQTLIADGGWSIW
ncbi:SDR family oxidoreductase [Ectothiorhodospira shaposhnikovii]|uniref:SDR family oxidoreductase n=1 Tax=Ectothiorhodospira shaposhnikovii TaxID=1054 RepID=UPI0039A1A014